MVSTTACNMSSSSSLSKEEQHSVTMNPRQSATFISGASQLVKINHLGVQKIAAEILEAVKSKEFKPTNMMIHSYPLPQEEDSSSIEWLFVCDCLNFSFWALQEDQHYTVELHGVSYTGYMALCAALTKAIEAGIPITSPEYFSTINESDVDKIFMSSSGESIPMLAERVKVLNEAGRILKDKFSGSFTKCVMQANQSAENLLSLIVNHFPSFRDEAIYAGKKVSFYKRAQILIADIWGLFKGKGLGQFNDIDYLTMFADYRVPQTLVYFGALEYAPMLNDMLKENRMFKNGTSEEVEIRGCSIHAVELIREELKHLPPIEFQEDSLQINSAIIDYFLWEYRRRFAKELSVYPYHKVRCIYY